VGHVPHLLHFLFEETKVGGWVAALFALAAGAITWSTHPILVDSELCKYTSNPCTSQVLDGEAIATIFGAAVLGGALGVGVAMFLVIAGVVDKSKLGVHDE
jgi:hypothetical protein